MAKPPPPSSRRIQRQGVPSACAAGVREHLQAKARVQRSQRVLAAIVTAREPQRTKRLAAAELVEPEKGLQDPEEGRSI